MLMLRCLMLVWVISLSSSSVYPQQNLVSNGSFEQISFCPQMNDPTPVIDWGNPTLGTPDYFNSCNGEVPQNIWGYQDANTGNAYLGISTMFTNAYREYIQCRLIQPLDVGKKYSVSFYLSRGDSCGAACDQVGAFFSDEAISSTDAMLLPITPQVSSGTGNLLTNAISWQRISGTFLATGSEEYLTIGVFSDSSHLGWITIDSNSVFPGQAYYYIDDVSVTEYAIPFPLEMPTAFTPNSDGRNDTYYPIFFNDSIRIEEFRVYNRWGEQLHNSPSIGWNGNYKNEAQLPGTYLYYIAATQKLTDSTKEVLTLRRQGAFTLLR